ncbi:hypothetical protein OG755_35700 [Streptomyces sp. NBC_01443]|nr:hypothetical protein [Streptomyces sp. NBC_01443]
MYAALEFPDLVSLVACQSGSSGGPPAPWSSRTPWAARSAAPSPHACGSARTCPVCGSPSTWGNTTRGCCPTANWSRPWPNRPERPYGCHARRRATTGPAGGTPSSGTSPARSSRACAR